jgi:hypothetical protein
MKWSSKVDDRTKEKIELLYREFDKFVEENHAGTNAEDRQLLKQWSSFKTVIEKNPTDFEVMHQHISQLGEEEAKEAKGLRSSPSPGVVAKGAERGLDLNRAKLKKMSNDLLNAIGKNNR